MTPREAIEYLDKTCTKEQFDAVSVIALAWQDAVKELNETRRRMRLSQATYKCLLKKEKEKRK